MMNAQDLPMPQGVLRAELINTGLLQSVRELMNYDVQIDSMVARWDTMINGRQYHHIEYKTDIDTPTKEWLERNRAVAIAKLKAIADKSTPA
jgi:hypothetical protein